MATEVAQHEPCSVVPPGTFNGQAYAYRATAIGCDTGSWRDPRARDMWLVGDECGVNDETLQPCGEFERHAVV